MNNSNDKTIKLVKVLETETPRVHFAWWVFWALLCWPVCGAVWWYQTYKLEVSYTVGILYTDGTKTKFTVNDKELKDLEFQAMAASDNNWN